MYGRIPHRLLTQLTRYHQFRVCWTRYISWGRSLTLNTSPLVCFLYIYIYFMSSGILYCMISRPCPKVSIPLTCKAHYYGYFFDSLLPLCSGCQQSMNYSPLFFSSGTSLLTRITRLTMCKRGADILCAFFLLWKKKEWRKNNCKKTSRNTADPSARRLLNEEVN